MPLLQDLCLSCGGRHGLGQVGPVHHHNDGHDDHHDQNGHDAGLVDDHVALDFMIMVIMLIMMIMHRRPYHKKCVKCVKCNKPLTPATLNEHQTQLYCLVFTDVNISTIIILVIVIIFTSIIISQHYDDRNISALLRASIQHKWVFPWVIRGHSYSRGEKKKYCSIEALAEHFSLSCGP